MASRAVTLVVLLSAGCASGVERPARTREVDAAAELQPAIGADASADARARVAGDVAPDLRPVAALDAAPAPTFTTLYRDYFGARTVRTAGMAVPGCQGTRAGECHSIATTKGDQHSFATRTAAYEALLRNRYVVPEDNFSQVLLILESGRMPEGGPRMPQRDIDRIEAWILAGARDD